MNEIRVLFYNKGSKSSVIDDISLIVNQFHDEANDVGLRNDICNDQAISGATLLYQSGMSTTIQLFTTRVGQRSHLRTDKSGWGGRI
jgi:hypothetical protein